jgi:proteasome accessory factor A
LILGDGHRSQFSLALQLGTTLLVLRSIETLPDRVAPLPRRLGTDQSRFWLSSCREFNRLARSGETPTVHPLALDVQRFYLDRVTEFVAQLTGPPPWTARLLADWAEVLSRLRDGDEDWLALRLDPWIKRRLFTAWLAARGSGWESLPSRPDLLDGLALLDQGYHTITRPDDLFTRLEAARLVEHRTGPRVEPGGEPDPFVPDVSTRARARARFIASVQNRDDIQMDWSILLDRHAGRCRRLDDPFASEFGPWQ